MILGDTRTSYDKSAPVTLIPGVKIRGSIEVESAVASCFVQYIQIPVVYGNQNKYIVFKDIEINGKTKLELSESIAEASVAVEDYNGTLDFHVTRCYDTSSETIVEFRIENHLLQAVSGTFNLDLCNSKDEYSLCYIPRKMMLAGSVAKSYQLPAGVYANGSLAFPKIDEISASVDELQMSFLVDEELYSVNLGPIAIEGRKPSLITPQVLWESNGVTFSLIGCYEKSGNLLIDYLLNNTTDSDLELTLSDDGRVFDDMANEYPIKLAGGSRY